MNLELSGAVNQDFYNFFVKSLSAHSPGWSSQWKQIREKHKNFNNFVVESFNNANESRLSKSGSLVGGHKNIVSLETHLGITATYGSFVKCP